MARAEIPVAGLAGLPRRALDARCPTVKPEPQPLPSKGNTPKPGPVNGKGFLPGAALPVKLKPLAETGTLVGDLRSIGTMDDRCAVAVDCPGDRIIELPKAPGVEADDAFIIDHPDRGTKQATARQLADFVESTQPDPPRVIDRPADVPHDDDVLPLDHETRGERKTTAENLAEYTIAKIPPPMRVIDRPHDTPTDSDAIGLDSEAEGERQTTVGELADLILSKVPPPPKAVQRYTLVFEPFGDVLRAQVPVFLSDAPALTQLYIDGQWCAAGLRREADGYAYFYAGPGLSFVSAHAEVST